MKVLVVASLLASGFGVVAGLFVFASCGRLRPALAASLELFMAAGLLRLSADATWSSLATAAAILVIRNTVAPTLTQR